MFDNQGGPRSQNFLWCDIQGIFTTVICFVTWLPLQIADDGGVKCLKEQYSSKNIENGVTLSKPHHMGSTVKSVTNNQAIQY